MTTLVGLIVVFLGVFFGFVFVAFVLVCFFVTSSQLNTFS